MAAIGFNPGEDPLEDTRYDLGILKMANGDLYLFGEFEQDDPDHRNARRNWQKRIKNTEGYCGLIIAMGVTGSSCGNPQLNDMLALYEAKSINSKDLDLIFYDDLILETPELKIPHPRCRERAFVLLPLAEIAPDWRDPVTGKTILQLLGQLGLAE